MVAGPVFYAGGSGRAYVLRAERATAENSARDRDGLLPADWNDLRVGGRSQSHLEGLASALPLAEWIAAAGALHGIWLAPKSGDRFLPMHGCGDGDWCFDIAVFAP